MTDSGLSVFSHRPQAPGSQMISTSVIFQKRIRAGRSARAAGDRGRRIEAALNAEAVWSEATSHVRATKAARAVPPEPQATGAEKLKPRSARRRFGAKRHN